MVAAPLFLLHLSAADPVTSLRGLEVRRLLCPGVVRRLRRQGRVAVLSPFRGKWSVRTSAGSERRPRPCRLRVPLGRWVQCGVRLPAANSLPLFRKWGDGREPWRVCFGVLGKFTSKLVKTLQKRDPIPCPSSRPLAIHVHGTDVEGSDGGTGTYESRVAGDDGAHGCCSASACAGDVCGVARLPGARCMPAWRVIRPRACARTLHYGDRADEKWG